MSYLRELLTNANAIYRLQPKYYSLATSVGIVGVGAGIAVMYAAGHSLALMLGESPEARASTLRLSLFLLVIPISLGFGMVLVASIFSLYMVSTGRFTLVEAWYYASRSRYPKHWFASGEA